MASQTFDLSNVDKVEFLQGGVAKEVDVLKLNDTVIWKTLPYVEQDFIFTVERYTTNTYVDETSYTDDEIIAFDITAGEGGCTVTYGDVTTTIPASTRKEVIYGKYKGVDDGTPTAGALTISGDYKHIAQTLISTGKVTTGRPRNVTGIIQWFGSQLKTLKNFFLTSAEIDAPEFEYLVNIISLEGLMNSSSRTTIPVNLIKQCVKVTDFGSCFRDCTGLTSIPANLFENNTAVTAFNGCFVGCTGITSIPENLFKYNTAVTTFYECFNACTGITSIPENLFKYNTAVTDFRSCFRDCTGLTSIPANLFINNPAVTEFDDCFNGCTGITEIPTNLFANNTAVTSFFSCFNGCTALTGTTPVNASGLELWQLAGTTGYPATITGTGCFTNCTGLSNYTNIPSDWGGGATA